MSPKAAPAPEKPTPPKTIPPVTDAYRKAHKAYVLASGLLLSWEVIGIKVDPGPKWGIELLSPRAVPLILFALVFYSAYKITIEWMQCHEERRKNLVATLDYWVAHLIAVSGVGISIYQYSAKSQIVDVVEKYFDSPSRFFLLTQVAFFTGVFTEGVRNWRTLRWPGRIGSLIISIPGCFLFGLVLARREHGYRFAATGVLLGIVGPGLIEWFARQARRFYDEILINDRKS